MDLKLSSNPTPVILFNLIFGDTYFEGSPCAQAMRCRPLADNFFFLEISEDPEGTENFSILNMIVADLCRLATKIWFTVSASFFNSSSHRQPPIILLSLQSKMSNPVTISPNIQSGEPVFTNTRVPVKNLFDYLKAGHSLNEFIEDFPSVKKEQAIQVIDHFENLLNFHAIANEKGAA